MAGREHWMAVASGATDDVREGILTGYKRGKPFTPYVPTMPLPSPIDRVLDFGCGLGRNFPYLNRIARSVSGFDLPPMIERCRAVCRESVDVLSSEWEELAAGRFDLIVASLVLQHLEPAALRGFLRDFARMAPLLYVLTRVRSDFDENVFEIIAATELYDADLCVEVDHDPDTHQLRALGQMPVAAARAPEAAARHVEVLLSSRHAG